jgi:hypothetical protein
LVAHRTCNAGVKSLKALSCCATRVQSKLLVVDGSRASASFLQNVEHTTSDVLIKILL